MVCSLGAGQSHLDLAVLDTHATCELARRPIPASRLVFGGHESCRARELQVGDGGAQAHTGSNVTKDSNFPFFENLPGMGDQRRAGRSEDGRLRTSSVRGRVSRRVISRHFLPGHFK